MTEGREKTRVVQADHRVVPTPRSWARVARILAGEADAERFRPLLAGAVGPESADALLLYLRDGQALVSAREVIDAAASDREALLPSEPSALVALASSLSTVFRSADEAIAAMHVAGLIGERPLEGVGRVGGYAPVELSAGLQI